MADDERPQGPDEAGRVAETRAVDTVVAEAEVAVVREGSLYADAWRHLRRRPMFIIAALIIVLLITMAVWPSLFTSHDPRDCPLVDSLLRPSSEHWFGTDLQGCDYYAKTIYGARVSISIGVLVTVVATAVALVLGSIAGFYGGFVDTVIARITDIWFAIPTILGGIVILSLLGKRGMLQVSLVLIVLGWPTMLRLARSAVLSVKETDYMDAARALGATQLADHPPACAAQFDCPGDRLCDDHGGGDHLGGGGAVVPGGGVAVAGDLLGADDQRGPEPHPAGPAPAALPRHVPVGDGVQVHPDG